MLNILFASLIFDSNVNIVKKKNQAATSPEEKEVDDIMWFTCPHCDETYDIDHIDDLEMTCPVCGMDLEDEYDDLDIDEELAELYTVVGQMKEYIEELEDQVDKMNKRLKNLESK